MGDSLALLPPGLGAGAALFLIGASFIASAITAVAGLGGGIAMLAAMSPVVPVFALIPLHGVIQFGSNFGRCIVHRHRIDRRILALFSAGGIVGAAIGSQVLVNIPGALNLIGIGAFVLVMTWVPKLSLGRLGARAFVAAGAVSTFLTLFVGASGPIVAATLAGALTDRRVLIGTHASCMAVQNIMKLIVFTLAGFAFAPWLPLIAGMIAAGFLGTLVGTRMLYLLPERQFRLLFRIVITVLGLDMVRRGIIDAI